MTESSPEYQTEREHARFLMRAESLWLYDEAFREYTTYATHSTIESSHTRCLVIRYIENPEARCDIEAWLKNFHVTGRMSIAYLRGVVKANQRIAKLAEGGNDAGL